jgi:hypothetical protein
LRDQKIQELELKLKEQQENQDKEKKALIEEMKKSNQEVKAVQKLNEAEDNDKDKENMDRIADCISLAYQYQNNQHDSMAVIFQFITNTLILRSVTSDQLQNLLHTKSKNERKN